MAAVEPARRLVGAHRDLERQRRRSAFHAPEHEHARLLGRTRSCSSPRPRPCAAPARIPDAATAAIFALVHAADRRSRRRGRAARRAAPRHRSAQRLCAPRRCITTAIEMRGFSTAELYAVICYDFSGKNTLVNKVIAIRIEPRAPRPLFQGGTLADTRGRPMRDLRISVTDRCNFRCAYCMPREVFDADYSFLPHDDDPQLRGNRAPRAHLRRPRRGEDPPHRRRAAGAARPRIAWSRCCRAWMSKSR